MKTTQVKYLVLMEDGSRWGTVSPSSSYSLETARREIDNIYLGEYIEDYEMQFKYSGLSVVKVTFESSPEGILAFNKFLENN